MDNPEEDHILSYIHIYIYIYICGMGKRTNDTDKKEIIRQEVRSKRGKSQKHILCCEPKKKASYSYLIFERDWQSVDASRISK